VTRRLLVLAALAAVALPGAQAAPRPVPSFDHVIVIVFENKVRGSVLDNRSAPTFNSLASRYAVLAGYRGVTHPSLPNYLALISGSTQGITDDCTSCSTGGRSLADTLEAKGRTWKAYAEGLPRAGWNGAATGRYVKRHVPFLYFRRVVTRPARLRNVVPLSALSRDLAAKRLPDFSLVVPDMCHDMHDCSVATGDGWLKRFLPPLLRSRQLANSAIFIVFDESDSADPRVAGLALGPLVRPGSVYAPAMSHYGLLRTIEDAWGLPRLGRSARVAPVTGIWGPKSPLTR
jgi:phosphatidylinositol-3-phosphatase